MVSPLSDGGLRYVSTDRFQCSRGCAPRSFGNLGSCAFVTTDAHDASVSAPNHANGHPRGRVGQSLYEVVPERLARRVRNLDDVISHQNGIGSLVLDDRAEVDG